MATQKSTGSKTLKVTLIVGGVPPLISGLFAMLAVVLLVGCTVQEEPVRSAQLEGAENGPPRIDGDRS